MLNPRRCECGDRCPDLSDSNTSLPSISLWETSLIDITHDPFAMLVTGVQHAELVAHRAHHDVRVLESEMAFPFPLV